MRLIDIDKLVSDYKGKNKSLQNVTWFELTNYEVKAIPIEWMKKWHKEEDRRIGDGWTHVEHPHSFSRMVADWEKENVDNQKD